MNYTHNMQTPSLGPHPLMSSSKPIATEVDNAIWRAVAGASVRIPAVNSYVYYFPEGHLEHFSTCAAVNSYNFTQMRPWIPCQVISVQLLSDPISAEAFAKILLQPLQPADGRPNVDEIGGGNVAEDEDIVSFAKVLTRSDANNGGGFSVPRFCADMILPELNFKLDPPFQNLVMRDTNNNVWEFRHIYRGTPRRHLLTTGWSRFVNAKVLVSGDSVVFIRKKSTDELFLGVRREKKFTGAGGDGREALVAIENAVRGMPFEVVYYPKIGAPDFIVKAEKVKAALRMMWSPGMRVRLAVETDDTSRMTWIQGVVNAVAPPITGIWCGSPWRMLQVTWDEEGSTINNKVSPWQVEYMPVSPLLDPDFPNSKRFRFLHDPAVIPFGFESRHYSFSHGESSLSSQPPMSSAPLNYSPLPAGIQEVRRDHHHHQHQMAVNEPPKEETEPETNAVSTILTLGNLHSGNESPVSPDSVISGQSPSIRLFGAMIRMEPGNGEGGTVRKENGTYNA